MMRKANGILSMCGVVICLGALSCASQPSVPHVTSRTVPNPTPTVTGEYRIRPLDALQITVFNEPNLSLKVRVSSQGKINYPLLGSVQVSELTVPEAEKKLADLLANGYLVQPSVTVGVDNMSHHRVVVLGQVKSPGTLEMLADEGLTLVQAIGRVGGFTDFAAQDRVMISRSANGKEDKIIVNVAEIIKSGNRSADVELRPDDVVSVPEKLF